MPSHITQKHTVINDRNKQNRWISGIKVSHCIHLDTNYDKKWVVFAETTMLNGKILHPDTKVYLDLHSPAKPSGHCLLSVMPFCKWLYYVICNMCTEANGIMWKGLNKRLRFCFWTLFINYIFAKKECIFSTDN